MNFGYPFTPYNTMEGYMGNVATNPNMTQAMPTSGCGCGTGQQYSGMGMTQPYIPMGVNQPIMPQGCGQILEQTCAVDIPYYVNYNTHMVNNVVRRHIQIPVYTQTQETVYFDEWQTGCGCGR